MSLEQQFTEIVDDQAADWSDMLFELILPDASRLDEARLLMAYTQLERTAGTRDHFTFRISNGRGYGAFPGLAASCLRKLDDAGITGELGLMRVLSGVDSNLTQGPQFWEDIVARTR